MRRSSPVTGWPMRLTARRPDRSALVLRPLDRADRAEWESLRERNEAWLAPWEASSPGAEPRAPLDHRRLVRALDRQAGAGRMLPFVIEHEGALAGSMWLSDIEWSSLRTGQAGYWVDRRLAGQGIAPLALAMLTDFALGSARLHRVEVNVQPHNAASVRVVEKVGFRDEGVRERYQFIDGAWRDHRTFALTAEEVAGRCLAEEVVRARR